MRALCVVGIRVCCVVCNLSIIEYLWFNETRRRCVRHQLFIGMGGCYIVLWLAVKIVRGGSLTRTTTQSRVGVILVHTQGLSKRKTKITITKSKVIRHGTSIRRKFKWLRRTKKHASTKDCVLHWLCEPPSKKIRNKMTQEDGKMTSMTWQNT